MTELDPSLRKSKRTSGDLEKTKSKTSVDKTSLPGERSRSLKQKSATNIQPEEDVTALEDISSKPIALPETKSVLRFRRIIQECEIRDLHRDHDDWRDTSLHPSYTNFKVPYFMICMDRYIKSREKYEQQFQYEISELLDNQTSAYEAARFSRHMCITTLWPPLHNRREIKSTQRYFFPLTHKQRRRYQYIMSTDFN